MKCVCALNKDVRVGVKDQANDSIYRWRKCVYFILVLTIHLRMHNAMLLASGGFFCSACRLQQGNAGVDEDALT